MMCTSNNQGEIEMSAFIVSNTHIDAIVTYAMYNCPELIKEYQSPNIIGRILLNQNVDSVNYRYDDKIEDYEYKFTTYMWNACDNGKYSKEKIIADALRCLDYQCCECEYSYDYIYITNAISKSIFNNGYKQQTKCVVWEIKV